MILLLSAGACSEKNNAPMLKLESERNCVVNYLGNDYNCTLSFLSDGMESVRLNSPETLSGLTFRCSNGKYTVSLGSLICRSDTVLIPDNSFPVAVYTLMNDLKKNKDSIMLYPDENGYSYSSNSKVPYTVKTDNNGSITKIMLGNI